MNKIILVLLFLILLYVVSTMIKKETKQINVVPDDETLILPKSFKQQSIDDPLYHEEYIHKFDSSLGL